MRDPKEATDGPPDPQLEPERSPGFDSNIEALEDIEVSRSDVTIGEATPRELTASDTEPLEDATTEAVVATLEDGDVVERRRAALALGAPRHEGDLALAALTAAATEDPDADVRQFTVEVLGNLGEGAAGEGSRDQAGAVARSLLADDDPWVRAEAVIALDHLDPDAHGDAIEEALDDDHHAVRRNAAISLFKHRGEDALDPLLVQAEDESERVREWAAHLLGGIDDDRARSALEDLRRDEANLVAQTAERALAVEPGRFRRQFRGGIDEGTTLPGEDRLNRRPDL
ncbi:MAG: HEAT repeat domain-containing protein [Haloarculaceae archaeon]